MNTNTNMAYAAGYIDGDGCFYIGKQSIKNKLSPKFILSMTISSVNPEVLEWFKKFFGGSYGLTNSKIPSNQRPQYNFVIKKRATLNLIPKILPYLVEKNQEAQICTSFDRLSDTRDKIALIDKMYEVKNFTNLVSREMKHEFEQLRNTITPKEEDFAYLAGFIDAECSLGIQRYRDKKRPNHIYKTQLQCNNTKYPIFKWLLQRFGGQVHFIDRKSADMNQRNQLSWRLSSAALNNILSKIHPFLKYKKPVCEELMKFYNTNLPNGGARHTEKFRMCYAQIIAEREDICTKIHLLNLKGINT
jgi:hypothetical protein